MEKAEEKYLKIIDALNKAGVKYLVVGGIAVNLYGVERATYDIDIFVERSLENAEKIVYVFEQIGYKNISTDLLFANETVSVENDVRVHIFIPKTEVVVFKLMYQNRVDVEYKNTTIPIPDLKDLIQLKKMAGRPQDMEDVEELEKKANFQM